MSILFPEFPQVFHALRGALTFEFTGLRGSSLRSGGMVGWASWRYYPSTAD